EQLNFELMEHILMTPVMLIIYVIGILSTTFHFANGLWSFLITWGITQSPKSQRMSTYVVMFIFLVMSYIGIRALFSFV
ncbi:MAG TPA: succinate dehydrogenase, partial [Candidatus Avamphibacillus intestinigallinarum]|nr:succinate dehydrogenase [Candidatus Avamphibacillus intestinigallinarum]